MLHWVCFQLSLLFLCLVHSSCTLHHLDVQTQYFNHENLASYHVGTPDPQLNHPTIGQRLLIQWSLSSEQFEKQPLYLSLKVRFHNHQEDEVSFLMTEKKGTYLYNIRDEIYSKTQGILTYKVEIHTETCVIDSWKHPLWADLITLDVSN